MPVNQHLTPERIENALRTLFELDRLSGETYATKHEANVRKVLPHSEGHVIDVGKKGIEIFTLSAPPANANGMKMLSSAFANMIMFCDLKEELDQVVKIVKQEIQKHGEQ